MIKIGFSTRKKNILSMLIRWLTNSRVSHSFLIIDDETLGGQFVFEATDPFITIIPLNKFKSENDLVAVYAPIISLDNVLKEASNMLGESYSYTGLFGMIFVILGRWLKRKWNNPFSSSSSLFCSEFIILILQMAKYPFSEKILPQNTEPDDILKILEIPGNGIEVSIDNI